MADERNSSRRPIDRQTNRSIHRPIDRPTDRSTYRSPAVESATNSHANRVNAGDSVRKRGGGGRIMRHRGGGEERTLSRGWAKESGDRCSESIHTTNVQRGRYRTENKQSRAWLAVGGCRLLNITPTTAAACCCCYYRCYTPRMWRRLLAQSTRPEILIMIFLLKEWFPVW